MPQSTTTAIGKIHFITLTPENVGAIVSKLETSGFEVTIADSVMGFEVKGHPPDIILSTNRQALREHTSSCMSILLTDINTLTSETYGFDFVVPAIPELIASQLTQIINIIQKNRKLASENSHLIEKNKQLNSELNRKNRATSEIEILKNAIVRNVSHELKTPLLQVKSAVALIAEDVENERLVTYAKNATARLEILVKNITLLGSSLDTNLAPVIVREAIEHARRNIGRIWEHRADSDRFVIELESDLPPVFADKQGLGTVLQLLMDNALKFSKGNIKITASRTNDHVNIAVSDEGIGIPQKYLDAIFDTFYQVDNSTTRNYGGTGVGLAIARLILENHNSSVEVKSTMGKGSTFMFALPIVDL